MDIKDLYPGCTYHHDNTWSVLNDPTGEAFDFIFQPDDFHAIYECMLFPEQLAPIPLTQQMFLDLGFVEHHPSTYFYPFAGKFFLNIVDTHFILGMKPFKGDFIPLTPLVYLHDLQRAYEFIGENIYLGTEKNLKNAPQT